MRGLRCLLEVPVPGLQEWRRRFPYPIHDSYAPDRDASALSVDLDRPNAQSQYPIRIRKDPPKSENFRLGSDDCCVSLFKRLQHSSGLLL